MCSSDLVARYTREQECSGVVCGHIHVPAHRRLEGIDYYNCGDWVEHCTALVEHVDGRLELAAFHEAFPGAAAIRSDAA